MTDLTFSLSIERRDRESYLVLHVQDKSFPSRIVYADRLGQGVGAEKELFQFLCREHLKALGISALSDKVSTVSIQKIRIGQGKALDCLKLLALARKLQWKGSSIFFNPLSRADVSFDALEEEGILTVTGICLFEGKRIPFSKLDLLFLSDTPWCIAERSVIIFSDRIDRHLLSKVYPDPLVLEGKKKDQFIELYKDEEEGPNIVWHGHFHEVSPESSLVPLNALPVLILQDIHGVFANLFMDYGPKGRVAFHDAAGLFRDRELEKSWEKDLLETGFLRKQVGSSHYYCPSDQVSRTLSFLLELGWKVIDYRGRDVLRQSKSYIDIKAQGPHMLISGDLSYENHKVDLSHVVGAFLRRERFVEISPFAVGLMDRDIEDDLIPLADAERTSEGMKIKTCKAGLLGHLWKKEGCHFDSSSASLIQRMQQAKALEMVCPSPLFHGSLYPYQQEGVNWLDFLYSSGLSGLLADEMGLGKTVQVLAFLSRLKELKGPVCVIAPTSLLFHWKREFEKFLPSYRVFVHGGKDRLCCAEDAEKYDVVITSYAYLRIDESFLRKIPFSIAILDEAQTIKNPDSQVAQSAFSLQSSMKVAITGTPIENRWDDLWSLFHFLEPQLLGTRSDFRSQVLIAESDDRYLKRVKQKISPFILRRTKEMVSLDLPEKILQTIYVEMTSSQRAIYEQYMAGNRSGLLRKIEEEGIGKRRMEVLEALLRLRQICSHPHLADDQLEPTLEYSGKIDRILADTFEVVEEGKKVILFSQFTEMLALLKNHIEKANIAYVYLDGSTKDRESVVESFQKDCSIQVFLMSLKAGGVGLNLTAADYVFLCDPWWNDAVERQAIDRAHRLGRKDVVVARRYITAESVEEKMMKLKEQKTALADGIMEMQAELSSLNMQQIAELLY